MEVDWIDIAVTISTTGLFALTRETHREDSREMSRAIEMAKYEIEQKEKERNRNAGN